MATYKKRLKNKNGDIIHPVTTVDTDEIVDGAVNQTKIDWTNVGFQYGTWGVERVTLSSTWSNTDFGAVKSFNVAKNAKYLYIFASELIYHINGTIGDINACVTQKTSGVTTSVVSYNYSMNQSGRPILNTGIVETNNSNTISFQPRINSALTGTLQMNNAVIYIIRVG